MKKLLITVLSVLILGLSTVSVYASGTQSGVYFLPTWQDYGIVTSHSPNTISQIPGLLTDPSGNIYIPLTPTASGMAATKGYVDTLFIGLDWQASVLNFWDASTNLPVAPTLGDRYIASSSGNGWIINHIYQCITAGTWTAATDTSPNKGFACNVEDENVIYTFNGTAWVLLGTTFAHNDTFGKQGGTVTPAEYFHLTSAQSAGMLGLTEGRIPKAGAAGVLGDSVIRQDASGNIGINKAPALWTDNSLLDISGNLIVNSLTASMPVETDVSKNLVSGTKTGTGSIYVMQQSPSIIDASLNTATINNATALLPVMTDASKNLVTNTMTGTGSVVFSASPSVTDPSLNTATLNALTASMPVETDGSKILVSGTKTGTGSIYVMQQSPSIIDASLNTATLNALTASLPVFTDGNKILVSNNITGTGNVVMDSSPTITGATFSSPSMTDVSMNAVTINDLTASMPVETNGSKLLVSGTKTGTGSVYVMQQSPSILDASLNTATLNALTASLPVMTDVSKNLVTNAMTGTGSVVFSTSPTIKAPIAKGPAIVNSGFVGTVTAAASTTVTFSSAADAILAGYDATNPILGTTLISNALTRYIVSWTNSTTCVVDSAVTWAGTAITSVQLPIATFVNSAGVTTGWMLASGVMYIPGSVGIGTTAPSGLLNISGSSPSFRISDTQTNGGQFFLQGQVSGTTGYTRMYSNGDYTAGFWGNGISVGTGYYATQPPAGGMIIQGNVGIGTTTFGTSAAKVLAIGEGTAPSDSPANASQLWSADKGGVATKNAFHMRDESGKNGPVAFGNLQVTTHSATESATADTMFGNAHIVTGAYIVSIPTLVVGYNATFTANSAAAFSLDFVTGTDLFILNGTALTAGNKVTTDGTIYASLYVKCIEAGKAIVTVIQGVAFDGGA
jgi:hypothetical protein